MGISDKLKFWQKEEDDFSDLGDFGLGDDMGSTNKPTGSPADDMFSQGHGDSGGDPFGAPAQGMQQPAAPQQGPAPATPPPSGTDMFGAMGQGPQQPTPPAGPITPPAGPSQMPQPQPAPAVYGQSQDDYQKETFTKDVEIISAKLDSLRATLESINQRLANIERLAQGEQQGKRRYEW